MFGEERIDGKLAQWYLTQTFCDIDFMDPDSFGSVFSQNLLGLFFSVGRP